MCHNGRSALLLPSCWRNAHTIHFYKYHLDINLSMTMVYLFKFSQYELMSFLAADSLVMAVRFYITTEIRQNTLNKHQYISYEKKIEILF